MKSTRKKSICHIITGLGTGGAEMALSKIVLGSQNDTYSHSVISLTTDGTYGEVFRQAGIPVISLGMNRNPARILKLLPYVKKHKPDILFGWMYHGNLAAWFGRKFGHAKSKLIWNIRHSLYDIKDEKRTTGAVIKATAKLSKGVDAIVYCAHVSRQQHETIGFSAKPARVVPNGFDTTAYAPNPSVREQVRNNLGIPTDEIVIGNVGRFHPDKGHPNFLQAVLPLMRKNPQISILLVGRNVSYDTDYFSEIVPDEFKERIRLLGNRSDVPDLMKAMDIFVLPSDTEAFPNVLGEAMACGLPCIATDVGDCNFMLGTCGLIVTRRDSDALGNAVGHVVNDPDLRKQYGQEARQRIKNHFHIYNMIEQYEAVFDAVCAQ